MGVANLSSQLVLGTPWLCTPWLCLPQLESLASCVGPGDLNLSPLSQVATALTMDPSLQLRQGLVNLQMPRNTIHS